MTEVEVSILKQNVRSFINNFNKNDIIDYQTLLIYIYKLYQAEENKIIQEIINNLFTKYPEWFKENLLGRNFPITTPEHYQKLLVNIKIFVRNTIKNSAAVKTAKWRIRLYKSCYLTR